MLEKTFKLNYTTLFTLHPFNYVLLSLLEGERK